jgi:hypothetical protein
VCLSSISNVITFLVFLYSYVSYDPKYEEILSGLEGAIAHRSGGGDCVAKYTCPYV